MNIIVRYAEREELERVNEIRKMVSEVHVNGRPDIFRPGFCEELKDAVYQKFDSEDSDVIVALIDKTICGFEVVDYIDKPINPYSFARKYLHIEEFGVHEDYRRMGVATALVEFAKQEAAKKGYSRIELDMWEFNEGALKFYESVGFKTYRRYLELDI